MIWTASFWRQAAERAIKTAAEAGLAFFVVGETGVLNVNWAVAGSIVGAAAVASVLFSLASTPFGPPDSPSLVGE